MYWVTEEKRGFWERHSENESSSRDAVARSLDQPKPTTIPIPSVIPRSTVLHVQDRQDEQNEADERGTLRDR